MNNLQSFAYGEAAVRVIDLEGEPWWILADVCRVLEHSNSRMVADRLDEDEKGVSLIYTPGGPQNMTVINEPGLYSVILRSDKPQARDFKRWITHEVLPAIRKTGQYAPQREYMPTRPLTTDDYAEAAKIVAKCHNSRLPLVLDLLKKAGYDLAPIERAKQEAPPTWRDEREARRAHMVALLNQFSLPELCRRLGLSKSTVQYYRTGEFVPRMDRYRAIVHILEG
ncbi:BRO family protein [Acutalibacter caecimuris]|uniref:BRO family protein n=1 Tax=Acutalibacter caecimuris TaxID=3093657 RepID=UPI002AC8AF8C|nr:BRO family protein [Acutalibacter sp. M00118]